MIESTANQYAAPAAMVADVRPQPEGWSKLNLFSAKGRIGRLRYLAYCSASGWLHALFVSLAGVMVGNAPIPVMVISIASLCVLVWFTVITGIKRCHDLNISGWWTVTIIIPVIGLVWMFFPGTRRANRFGAPPPPNTTGVRILGLILPVIVAIGVAAAVALPAYNAWQIKTTAAKHRQ